MTYDELLAKFENWGVENPYVQPWKNALFEVVKLHKPAFATVDGVKGPEWCYQCAEGRGYAKWPCPTIQAIEKALS